MVQQIQTSLTQAISDSNLPHISQMYKLPFIHISLTQSVTDSNLTHKPPLTHISLTQAATDSHLSSASRHWFTHLLRKLSLIHTSYASRHWFTHLTQAATDSHLSYVNRHWFTPTQAATDSHLLRKPPLIHISYANSHWFTPLLRKPPLIHLSYASRHWTRPPAILEMILWLLKTCWIIHRVTKRCVLVCCKNLIYVRKLQTGEGRGYLFLFPFHPYKSPDYCCPQDRAIECHWSSWPTGTTSLRVCADRLRPYSLQQHVVGVNGNAGVAPLVLNIGTRWRFIVTFTIRPLDPWQKNHGIHQQDGGLATARMHVLGQTKISCPCQDSNRDPVVRPLV